MTFLSLPLSMCALLCVAAAIVFFGAVYVFVDGIIFKASGSGKRLCLLALSFALALVCTYMKSATWLQADAPLVRNLDRIPALAYIVLAATLAVLLGTSLRSLRYWKLTHITQDSIKESVDHLPAGVCFAQENGRPMLVNLKMHALCRALCGSELLNADAFWESLRAENVLPENKILHCNETPIVQTGDQHIWQFERRRLQTFEKPAIYQICAFDVTKEYRLHLQIQEENTRLAHMNARLRAYGQNVEDATREEEILAAKVRIHSEFGQALLAARRYADGASKEPLCEADLLRWRQGISLLKTGKHPNQKSDVMGRLIAAAQSIGVTVCLEGAQPAASCAAARVLADAVHECLTNAVRHANGTKLWIESKKESGEWIFCFTNDGTVPKSPVCAGGGLSNLCRRVENLGGRMSIESAPRFMLRIALPMETEDDAQ